MDIIKKQIVLDKHIERETTQILLEGDIIVPDIKPDMNLMLQADGHVALERVEASQDRINFSGALSLQVLYLSEGGERPVHSITTISPIEDFINVEGVTKDTLVSVKADIANIEYNMINDRKINYKAVVDLESSGASKETHEAVVDIDPLPTSQKKNSPITVSKIVGGKNDRFILKEDLVVPNGKPNILEVLATHVEIRGQDVRVVGGKVQVTGDLNITTLYKGDNDQLLDFMEHEVPFTTAMDIEGAAEDMFADANLTILGKHIQVLANEDGEDRILELELTIGNTARVMAREELTLLDDAYSTQNQMVLDRAKVAYPSFVARNKNQANIKDIVTLPTDYPDILQVFRVKCKAILDDVKVMHDKIVAEGAIEVDILYIAKSDETPLYAYKTMIPYRQTIDTVGTLPEMGATLTVDVDGVHFNMLSNNEIELRITATFNTFVSAHREANIVGNVQVLEMDKAFMDQMASITVYIVQKGDTLWNIAKQYYTSVEALLELNHLENPDHLQVGHKLIILKKV